MSISTISVSDMHCAACAGKIRKALEPVNGIRTTHINPVRRLVLVDHGAETDPLELMSRIESAGFTPTLAGLDDHDAAQRILLKRLGIAGLAMMQVMMASLALYAGAFDGMEAGYEQLFRYTGLIFSIPVVCYSAMPFFTSALQSLATAGRGLGMDVPVALAIAIAFLTSLHATLTGSGEVYFDSVAMFTFLLLGARYIDNRLQHRFELSAQLLAALPTTAMLVDDGGHRSVPTSEVKPNDRLWIAEGAQIPVDGISQSDEASIDEAVLTGESAWVFKPLGAAVFAGSYNRGAGFEMIVTHPFDESRIADIARLADRAQLEAAPITRITDRIAQVFVPTVLALAALTFIVWQMIDPGRALTAALTVLVVSCPCALSLATPAALTAAMTRLRQLGIVLTGSTILERLPLVNRLFIDKTGTLTVEEPVLLGTVTLAEYDQEQSIALAAALQRHSSHPYARAFHGFEAQSGITGVTVLPGQGVEGQWQGQPVRIGSAAFAGADAEDGAVYLSRAGIPIARFELSDRIRDDAAGSLNALRALGITTSMTSGDAEERCADIAARLGIGFNARQSPEDKLEAIRREQADGNRVLMLGDGINDIPVLAGADVSAVVVEASDLVKSRADVLLLNRKLGPLVDLIRMGHRTRRVIRQNLGWAALYNLTAIPIAAAGLLPPWLAALGMASSSVLVMLNASRLLRQAPPRAEAV